MRVVPAALVFSTLCLFAPAALAQTSPPGDPVPSPTVAPLGSLAPNYRPFRVDLGFGWATIPAQHANGGNMSIEPKFNFLDNVTGGFRVDLMGSAGGNVGSGSGEAEIRQQFIAAGLVKVDYYATTTRIRPWASLAFGRYAINGQGTRADDDDTSVEYTGGSYYGISPQVGLELAAFRISATYNHLFGARVVVIENVGVEKRNEYYSSSYATIEIGVRLGGGRLSR
jgi:hypothetical protein